MIYALVSAMKLLLKTINPIFGHSWILFLSQSLLTYRRQITIEE